MPIRLSDRLAALRDDLKRLFDDEATNAWDIGHAVLEIRDNGLAVACGYESEDAFFAEQFPGIDDSTLDRNARLAEHFTRDQVVEFKATRLQALDTWMDRAGIHDQPLDLGAVQVMVPDAHRVLVAKRFADCTLKDMKAANRAAKTPRRRTAKPDYKPEDLQLFQRLEASAKEDRVDRPVELRLSGERADPQVTFTLSLHTLGNFVMWLEQQMG